MGYIGGDITLVVNKYERELISVLVRNLTDGHELVDMSELVQIVEDENISGEDVVQVKLSRMIISSLLSQTRKHKELVTELEKRLKYVNDQLTQFQ